MNRMFYILLIFGGIIFLALSIRNYFELTDKENLYYYPNESIDVGNFYGNLKTTSHNDLQYHVDSEFTFLYLIDTDDCNVCRKELEATIQFVDDNYSNENIEQIIVIIDDNIKRAAWFAKAFPFNYPLYILNSNAAVLNTLTKFRDSIKERQLIVINNIENKIKMRMQLIKGNITSREYKAQAISKLIN